MINKKQTTKEVFYNNTNYTVPHTSLKHIDGFDVIEIENDLYVCWDDDIKKWIKASGDLIKKYKKVTYDKITGNWIL